VRKRATFLPKKCKNRGTIGGDIDFENLAFFHLPRIEATKGGIGTLAYEMADAMPNFSPLTHQSIH
jgi:hypothetical protein